MKIIYFILAIIMLSCSSQKEVVDSYNYFKVDSVRSDGLYEILIKDPYPCDENILLFPSGAGTIIPQKYDRYIKIIYKSDSVWVKGDTLILQKK